MALTSGSVTIKLAGGTYSTWAAFWDDLGNLTGNITCTVDASAFTEAAGPAALTESLGGHILHVLPATFPTKTDVSDGARFTHDHTDYILLMGLEGAGTVIIEGMVQIEGDETPLACYAVANVSTGYSLVLRRNIIKGTSSSIYHLDSGVQDTKIYNNIIFDCTTRGLRISVDIPDAIIANNTVVHSADDNVNAGDEEIIFKNNISYGATDLCWIDIELLTEGYNNASSDATGENADFGGGGNNNLSNIADPFNNIGNDDFTITVEGIVGTAGLDLSGDFTDDFFGVERSNWTIGACEYVGVGAAGIMTTNTGFWGPIF